MAQKSDMINDLIQKKEEAEKKFVVAQNSSRGYANAKANYDEFQKDREKFARDLLDKDEEISVLKVCTYIYFFKMKKKNRQME